jgi:hypothetical protein
MTAQSCNFKQNTYMRHADKWSPHAKYANDAQDPRSEEPFQPN